MTKRGGQKRRHGVLAAAVWHFIVGLVVCFMTGEWIVGKRNGGDTIVIRALFASGLLFVLVLLAYNLLSFCGVLSPTCQPWPSRYEWAAQVVAQHKLFFGLVAGTYAAFYARFSSQWNYLANLYNQIKAVEVASASSNDVGAKRLGEWKAGFIEDAWVLHLIKKPLFNTVVDAWRVQAEVKTALETHCKNRTLKRYLESLDVVSSNGD